MDWERESAGWPHREASRFVPAGGLRWHVQRFPQANAPRAVLIHGTGASTHSWRGVAPALQHLGFEVVAMDLPGHAFTQSLAGAAAQPPSLPAMARSLAALLGALPIAPDLLVGHSAGAAIALRLVLDGRAAPRCVASLNGALQPWRGLPGRLFSPLARLLAANPLIPALFARRAGDPTVVRRLLDQTGSRLDEEGEALYRRLVADRGHAAGALRMMANWDLEPLWRDLPRLAVPLVCLVGTDDRTVPPQQAHAAQARLDPAARHPVTAWPGLGHLAHEQAPGQAAAAIARAWQAISERGRPG